MSGVLQWTLGGQKVKVTLSLAVNFTYSTQVVQANIPVVSCNTPYHYKL